MLSLPAEPTSKLWDQLEWRSGRLVRSGRKRSPLWVDHEVPATAGLYRMTWTNAGTWQEVEKSHTAKGGKLIPDLTVGFHEHATPCVLTIGKTTLLHGRIRNHFGTNASEHRVLKRLRGLLPGQSDDAIRDLCVSSITVEWVLEADWVKRSLLESYGKAVMRPVLDLDAEH